MANDDSSVIQIGPMSGFDFETDNWDYKGCRKIILIIISHGREGIASIQFHYEENGAMVVSKCHGTSATGEHIHVVTLKHPVEYITSVSGYKHFRARLPSRTDRGITSLSFTTNMREYGPIGLHPSPDDTKFSYNWGPDAQFWGFYGSCQYYYGLKCIGIYLKRTTNLTTTSHGKKVVVPKKEV